MLYSNREIKLRDKTKIILFKGNEKWEKTVRFKLYELLPTNNEPNTKTVFAENFFVWKISKIRPVRKTGIVSNRHLGISKENKKDWNILAYVQVWEKVEQNR